MRIILTEVTEMRNQHICIAGWSPEEERMIRPLPGNSGDHQWSAALARADHFAVGNVIDFQEATVDPRTDYPHHTEDLVIRGSGEVVGRLEGGDLCEAVADSVFEDFNELFNGCMIDRHAVPPQSQCRSLGAIRVNSKRLGFSDKFEKLRCWFYIGNDDKSYDLPVTCTTLRDRWHAGEIDEVQRTLKRARNAYIRIGLTRPWVKPQGDRELCWMQVNGILAQGL